MLGLFPEAILGAIATRLMVDFPAEKVPSGQTLIIHRAVAPLNPLSEPMPPSTGSATSPSICQCRPARSARQPSSSPVGLGIAANCEKFVRGFTGIYMPILHLVTFDYSEPERNMNCCPGAAPGPCPCDVSGSRCRARGLRSPIRPSGAESCHLRKDHRHTCRREIGIHVGRCSL